MSTTANETLDYAPALLLQQVRAPQASKDLSYVVQFVQLRVKAKLDKLKESLEWERYLKSCTLEPEETGNKSDTLPVTTPQQQHLDVSKGNLCNDEVSTRRTRGLTQINEGKSGPFRKNQQSASALEHSYHQSGKENIPVSEKSLQQKMGSQFQKISRPTVHLNKVIFQDENIVETSGKQLVRPATVLKQEKYLTQTSRDFLGPVRHGFLHCQERRRMRNEALKSKLRLKILPLQATKRVQTDRYKSAPTKRVQFANDLKHVDKVHVPPQKHQGTSTTGQNNAVLSKSVRQLLRKWKNSDEQIQTQMSELKNARAELGKLQEKEDQIRRKWNRFYGSAASRRDETDRPEVVLHQPHILSSSELPHNRYAHLPQTKSRIRKLEGIAESLFEDALHQVAQELSQISEDCVSRMYEEEFISPSFSEGFL